ncbi:synaptonemal complex central element protein 3 [Callorhinchus milii]|uniref:Synaptonemal complex central element protein 3 n=2 Tax=Callorhinchus milii TaxID=7868 RepID=A0A4W3KIV8_CALMI|nr:synaptonemal complex central element protein 3 [Callorhinchus milii]|eukprot:gi/632948396/ref/XP_007889575.1/ PREDICTED: synaptonemal complex central element protein 3 [Callorhinchus milii]
MAQLQNMAVIRPQMTKAQEEHEDIVKILDDMCLQLKKMLNDMEIQSVQATCMSYDMVLIRTDPCVVESLSQLNNAYLHCKETVEKDCYEILTKVIKN